MEADHQHALEEAQNELGELGEVWLEQRVLGRNNPHVDTAIEQATRDYRRAERKLRKLTKQ